MSVFVFLNTKLGVMRKLLVSVVLPCVVTKPNECPSAWYLSTFIYGLALQYRSMESALPLNDTPRAVQP